MLVRWSASSLSITTPSPLKAEPSRRMPGSFLQRLIGLAIEVMIIDRFEAWLLDAEIFEAPMQGDDLRRCFRAHVAFRVQAQLADASLLDPADARNERKPVGKSRAL